MRKIRVLFMQSQAYYGADSMIHGSIMRYLDRDSFEVHAACSYGSNRQKSASLLALEQIPNLHIRRTNFGPTVRFVGVKGVARDTIANGLPGLVSMSGLLYYTKRRKIDIIHCTEKPRDAFYGLLLARATGAKLVVHLHVAAADWISKLTLYAMKEADALIGISHFVSQTMKNMGYAEERIHTVYNGIDLAQWQPTDGALVRREFGIPPERVLIVIASRLFHWKGHTRLLHALAKVKTTQPNFTLLIVGEDDPRGAPGRGSYSAELLELVERLELGDKVIFTGHRRDMRSIMASCDIFAMPSHEEPFGMVFLEAMAMRKPVIAQFSGGTPEIVEHGKSGLLSAEEDIDGLASNLACLINDPTLRHQMGEYGHKLMLERFTAEKTANGTAQVYRTLVGCDA